MSICINNNKQDNSNRQQPVYQLQTLMLQKLENITILKSLGRQKTIQFNGTSSEQQQIENHFKQQQQANSLNNYINQAAFNQLQEQLRQCRKDLLATNYYLNKLRKKTIKSLQNNIQINKYIRVLQKYFLLWKQQVQVRKLDNLIRKKVFHKLKQNTKKSMNKNMRQIMLMTADNCYQKCLKAKIFSQWKITFKTEKKYETLVKNMLKRQFNRLINACQYGRAQKFTKQISVGIYRQKKLKIFFNMWIQFIKMQKVKRIIFPNRSCIFIDKFRKYYKKQITIYQKYYHKKQLNKIFQKFKLNMKYEKSRKHYQKKQIVKYFALWVGLGKQLFYQKQQQSRKQESANQFIKRKNKLLLLYSFEKWKNYVNNKIQNKKKNQIARQYGEVKQKQFILNKYFTAMKEFKYYNMADKFYLKKLKYKVIHGLKLEILKTASKWQNLYKFVQERQKKKYFIAIKKFIQEDKAKVNKFRLQKLWNKFTFTIVKNYVQNNTKAQKYHIQSLKFKVFYTLKQLFNIKIKTNKTIIFINANMNLRRWRKNHKIIQYFQATKYVIKAKVFRTLKLLRMNKIWSQNENQNIENKLTQKKTGLFNLRNNQFVTQDSIILQKPNMESPQRMFSLEYSISAYNSNNNNF